MAYGTTLSPERLYREKILAMQTVATDFSTGTTAGSTTAQTVTINDFAGKITTIAAGTQVPDATLTVTLTCAGVTAADVCNPLGMSLSSGTAAGFAVQSAVCTTNTVTFVIVNCGATNWAAPIFIVNYLIFKSLAASVAN